MHETTHLHTSFPSSTSSFSFPSPPIHQNHQNQTKPNNPTHSIMPEDSHQASVTRKPSGSSSSASPKPPEQSPNCPRCDSPNTKFCYYNNYSLSQPRHFCKTCRRYWTKGGALRNVPIGGGCRKSHKKSKASSSKDSSSSTSTGTDISSAFKFLHGLSPPIDFQFGSRFPSSSSSHNNQFLPMGNTNPSTSLMGFNWGVQEMGPSSSSSSSMNVNTNLASSIECLSSINQDLHWKLQQQRLSSMFMGGGETQNQNEKVSTTSVVSSSVVLASAGGLLENQMISPQQQQQQQQPILFQNLGISKPGLTTSSANHNNNQTTSDWFLENPYMAVTTNNNNNSSSHGNDATTLSNWNGVQAWSYNDLPQ